MPTVAAPMQLADHNCHIQTDVDSGVLFDVEALWCSFCQKPRFEDSISTEICICVSFETSNDAWIPQAVDSQTFPSLPTRHFSPVDTWLHGLVDADGRISHETSAIQAMIGISSVSTSLGLCNLSTDIVSSPGTSNTSLTRGTSVTGTISPTPSLAGCSHELDSSDDSEYRRMLNTRQRRREQNRNSQYRFRERRNQVLRELEDKVDNLTKTNEIMNREIAALRKKLGGTEGEFVELV